jgi:serine/threonine protein kinase
MMIASDDEEHPIFGRHGDIKPQNILWFPDTKPTPDAPVNGVLKLSDFGLTKYHRNSSRSKDQATSVEVSPTYRAPEVDVKKYISRSYDIWSLACTYLEFASWLLLGPRAIDDFARRREIKSDDGVREDIFFQVLHPEPSGESIALVNSSVSEVRLPAIL